MDWIVIGVWLYAILSWEESASNEELSERVSKIIIYDNTLILRS